MVLSGMRPRVAVVGGGMAGTLCSLVLKNRGLHPIVIDAGSQMGGRLRRNGAQFWRVRDPRLATVIGFLERRGLVAEWKGRFGLLGSRGGGFLPASVVTNHPTTSTGDSATPMATTDGGDFCRLVEGSAYPTFVGLPSMADLCEGICRGAGIETLHQSTMTRATPVKQGGWILEIDTDNPLADPSFDALVVATHDPSVAAAAIRSILQAEELAEDASPITARLLEIANSLQRVRDHDRRPVYAVSLTYPSGCWARDIPFDAVSIPGSSLVQFLARDASKPGRNSSSSEETWTAITTSQLATSILSNPDLATDQDKNQTVEKLVTEEISRLMAPYQDNPNNLSPTKVTCHRWGAAFSAPGLNLNEDSIVLEPWRLAICGDYIRDPSFYGNPLESAALSGLEAGERTAAFFGEAVPPAKAE